MKNRFFNVAFVSALALVILSACEFVETCTTCIEQNTQIESEFCGEPVEVRNYQDNLIESGKQNGEEWVCR